MKKSSGWERWINKGYVQKGVRSSLIEKFGGAKPFPHLELKGFLRKEAAQKLLLALSRERFIEKEADLFKLKQTDDMASTDQKELLGFRGFLLSEGFIGYLESITKCPLKRKTIDLSGSLYEDTDYLLCHDDLLEGRKIAFLFYLSGMGRQHGGALALLDKRLKVKKRIYPARGTFAFFEVSSRSFHEVEEVVSKRQRIAIGGWFHAQ